MPQYRDAPRTLLAQGVCQARAGQLAEAEATLTRAYELDPANPVTAINLAEVLYRRGEYERARFYMRRVNAMPRGRRTRRRCGWRRASSTGSATGSGVARLRHASCATASPNRARRRRSRGARSMSEAAGAPAPARASAGRLLREAREAQGLHIAALAGAIKVTPQQARGARGRPLRRSCPTPPSRGRWRRPSAAR